MPQLLTFGKPGNALFSAVDSCHKPAEYLGRVRLWADTVPLIRLIRDKSFDPEMVEVMSAAFEDALASLRLMDRTDPVVELVARKVIECAQSGIHERIQLRDCALRSFQS